ncbi:hypothetical protein J8V57_09630 [Xenorhabdus sp. PB61.4]|uniref:hypothetical protein n=1 Tax=Xenorhabdus sp. PB61.4 TaxID=2788940 RepID=UPI001E404914|nr:hypothetical protein [Xenorhabdus sp. PB61.4]MCC8366540.1 hypothetical protein [Xenorhabdus sp. PB61.4]
MIYIKNAGSFEKLKDWEILVKRVNFQQEVDLSSKKLLDAFGFYELSAKQPCGIKSCRKQHYKGVLVITEDGIETNIGHNCGFRIFGVKFENLATELTKRVNYYKTLTAVKEAKSKVWEYWQLAAKFQVGERNLQWVAHNFMDIKDISIIGRSAYQNIMRLAGSGNGKVTISRRKTAEESDMEDVMSDKDHSHLQPLDNETDKNKKPQYKQVVIGTIQHCESVLSDYDVALIYERDVKNVLNALDECNPDSMHQNKLTSLHIKVSKLDERIRFIEERIKKAQVFLTQTNLAPLYAKIESQRNVSKKDKELFSAFLLTLPEV